MSKPTIQDIFLHFYPRYLEKYAPSPQQAKVAHCIINCKTGAYGANVSMCEDCGHLQIHYNSCRNRCCPMCQALPKEKWMDKRREDVLEAPYFHVVFTVPHELNPLIYSNQQLLYDAMYHSVSSTINELTEDAKPIISRVGDILKQYAGYRVEVIGHTDNVPLFTPPYYNNEMLSAARAIKVAKYFAIEKNMGWDNIYFSGRGEHEPIADNNTEEGRDKNRRVEIRLYNRANSEN